MHGTRTPLERAFELAQSGHYNSASDIKRKLLQQGYSVDQLTGPALMKQLREILKQARQPS